MKHECIIHYSKIQEPETAPYPGSSELMSIGSPFGKKFGFKRLGIHLEVLKPGRRTSWPHAERTEEEFAFVVSGTPHVWIDGEVFPLEPGEAVGFKPGTGVSHTFINDSESDVQLLVVGDTNQCKYPLHEARNKEIGDFYWNDAPERILGSHKGEPKKQSL